jgi:hypothetical protein
MELLFKHFLMMCFGVGGVLFAIYWVKECIEGPGHTDGWTTYKEWGNVRQLREYERWAQVVVAESAPVDVPTGEIPIVRIEGS